MPRPIASMGRNAPLRGTILSGGTARRYQYREITVEATDGQVRQRDGVWIRGRSLGCRRGAGCQLCGHELEPRPAQAGPGGATECEPDSRRQRQPRAIEHAGAHHVFRGPEDEGLLRQPRPPVRSQEPRRREGDLQRAHHQRNHYGHDRLQRGGRLGLRPGRGKWLRHLVRPRRPRNDRLLPEQRFGMGN